MKKIFALFTVAAIIASCGQPDPKAKLAELKAKEASLKEEIQKLEAEISASDTTKTGKVKDVIVTPVTPGMFTHYIDVQGIVDADENVSVMPQMAGNITKVYVNEGDNVKQGQVLAETDSDIYAKQLNSLQPQLTLATDLFNRQKRLWEQKIGSEVQFLQAKTQKESLEKQIETIQEQIDLTRIKSPINGTVDYVGVKIGQLAVPGAVPAFRVVNMSSLKVKANISETYASKVKKGNNVAVYFPDLNKEVTSKVSFAARVIDPLTRTFVAEALLNAAEGEFHPNMIAVLKVIDYSNEKVISIPINLIQNSEDGPFIFVATEENGKKIARKRSITVGSTYNGTAEITSGLSAGDLVVTIGASDLADGLEIKF